MTLFALHATQITIPPFVIRNDKIARNEIIRYGFLGATTQAEFFESDITGAYLIKTSLPKPYDLIFLKKPRKKAKIHPNNLSLKLARTCDLEEINNTTSFQWLTHPLASDTATPEDIVMSWKGVFRFKEESNVNGDQVPGLRKPQLGALYAISSYLTLNDKKPVTTVLPTGTGKTETMLATMVSAQVPRLMVMVPSDALRTQIFNKFCSLGHLPKVGVLDSNCSLPLVAMIKKGVKSKEQAYELAHNSNVIVTTVDAFKACIDEAQAALADCCSHLFIDEAHHVAAKRWSQVRDLFPNKKVIQFTATPFRNDGQSLEGRIIYNYTMREAQEAGYFRSIRFLPVEEYYEDYADEAIARQAIECLRDDLDSGYDHLILARVHSIPRTKKLLELYLDLAPEYAPVIVHSKMGKRANDVALKNIYTRSSRIIICVDMFGEGFDLPNLKIAAIHEHHKSLAVTLQFIGRFTRHSSDQVLGDASVVLNIADASVQNKLQRLYSEDANWDNLLQRLSRNAIEREIKLQDVIDSLKNEGELHKNISLWNLRPSCSVILHKTHCNDWQPDRFIEVVPEGQWHKHAISRDKNILVVLIQRRTNVKWGKYQGIYDHNFALLIAHWDKVRNGLFIYASDYKAFRWEKLSELLCGEDVELITGNPIFRIFNDVKYPLVRNLGAARDGTISFTQYFGPNVTDGLAEVEKSSSNLSNIAGWGYLNGEKINWGCSQKKGKVWSVKAGPIPEWIEWCELVWDKVTDESTDCSNITKDFLKPIALTTRHNAIAVTVEWGEHVQSAQESHVTVRQGEHEYYLHEVSLDVLVCEPSENLRFTIRSEENTSTYQLIIKEDSPGYQYELLDGPMISIKKGSGRFKEFPEHMKADPIIFRYADSSFSYNNFLVEVSEEIASYPAERLEAWNWEHVDISKESMHSEQQIDTIQYATWQQLNDDYEVIINDDEAGEAADLVCLNFDSERNEITLTFVHCKYSSSPPGARVGDLYEVCGQAQKSIRWKHVPFGRLIDHLRKRDNLWREKGKGSRIIKGAISDLSQYKKLGRTARKNLEIIIVQPGINISRITDPMLKILGGTEMYLNKAAGANLKVVGSI